ncbi:hypothetical protein [Shimia marina]|uniref:Uncharacterized protein n=1 Tax=Shimia marina TaxID=321267 RepID=A0A0P1FDQ2_9RHOB|nr:hypothetical protein [Shimia marina]CUH52765.1 hypothetical protein SHM7688_02212 [Shimia marina]SFD87402.1 hypothetical protein SAMN04488037_10317 [Shimia marina]
MTHVLLGPYLNIGVEQLSELHANCSALGGEMETQINAEGDFVVTCRLPASHAISFQTKHRLPASWDTPQHYAAQ